MLYINKPVHVCNIYCMFEMVLKAQFITENAQNNNILQSFFLAYAVHPIQITRDEKQRLRWKSYAY